MLKDFTKCKFDIIILGGQSNADGAGCGDVEEPFWYGNRIWHLTEDFTICRASEKVYGNELQGSFSLSFCKKYINDGLLAEDRELLVVRAARGGTGFCAHNWGLNDFYFLRMLDMTHTALELNPENKIVAFLWHQGECDASGGVDYNTHYNNLKNLLNKTREEFNMPEMPFIAGDFVKQWRDENPEKVKPVRDAIIDVCKNLPRCAFVETDELLSNTQEIGMPDASVHFSRPALYKLGEKYLEAYKTLL